MRVAQVNTYRDRGGAGVASRCLHLGLLDEGVESLYFCAESAFKSRSVYPLTGSRRLLWKALKTIDSWISRRLVDDRDWRAGLVGLGPKVEGFEPDMIHLHWVQHGFCSLKDLSSLSQQKPVVWSLHDLWPLTDGGAFRNVGISSFAERKKRMRAALNPLWIAPSRFVACQAVDLGVDESKLTVLPNPVDMAVFSSKGPGTLRERLNISRKSKICVCSSVVESGATAKGGDLLRAALLAWEQRERRDEVVFVVIGRLERDLADLPFVRTLAPIKDRLEIAAVLADSDLFLSTSRFETFGLMIVEAQASGLPVVAFDVAAIPEVTAPEGSRFLAVPFKVESLISEISECLIRLESSPDLGERCRRWVGERFSSGVVAKAHVRYYESLLEDRS